MFGLCLGSDSASEQQWCLPGNFLKDETIPWVLSVGDFGCNCSFVYRVALTSGIWKSVLK